MKNDTIEKLRFTDENGNDYPKWEEKKLGEVGIILNGLTYSPDDIDEEGVLVLRSSNIKDRRLVFENNVCVKSEKFTPVKESDILICVRNGSKDLIGKNTIIDKKTEGFAFGAFMTIYRSDYNKFLFHWFDTDEYKKAVNLNLGATINSINGADLKKFKVPFPCLEEQQKIADFLSSIDEKTEKLEQELKQLKEYKKGVMQQLFNPEGFNIDGGVKYLIINELSGFVRFKDDNGNGYPNWVEKKIGDVLSIGSGRDYKHLKKGKTPVFGTGGLMAFVDGFLYEGETVCIGRKGTIDKPMFYNGRIWTVDTLFYTHSFINSIPKFIFYIFQNINWKQHNEASGVPSLSKSTIEKIMVNLPCISEQTKIADFLSDIDEKINQVAVQFDTTKEFKKGVMQQIFV